MSVRTEIVEAARWGVRNAGRIHYAEARPMPLRRTLPLATDCSGFATLCYYLAGAPDPNGFDYSGQGYTGTLLRHLRHIRHEAAQRGDIVVWGRYPGVHCAVVLDPGEDPLVASHGSERGPLGILFSAEQRVQSGRPVTWLDGLPSRDLAERDPGDRPGSVPGVPAGDAAPREGPGTELADPQEMTGQSETRPGV